MNRGSDFDFNLELNLSLSHDDRFCKNVYIFFTYYFVQMRIEFGIFRAPHKPSSECRDLLYDMTLVVARLRKVLRFKPCPIDNKSALVQAITWCGTGGEPLPKSMLTNFGCAHMSHQDLSISTTLTELNAKMIFHIPRNWIYDHLANIMFVQFHWELARWNAQKLFWKY